MGEKAPPNEKASIEAMVTVAEKSPVTLSERSDLTLTLSFPSPIILSLLFSLSLFFDFLLYSQSFVHTI